jgi:hypothetical protein
MGLFEAIEDLCAMDGLLGDATAGVLEGIFECCQGIGDALQGFADKLGEVETELAGEDGEEACCILRLFSFLGIIYCQSKAQ